MRFAQVGKIGLFACVIALASTMLFGCSGGATTQISEEAQANRAYMSQVNETMDQISTRLDSFIEAVSRDDVVNMRTQADDAYKALDKLAAIEPPEAFSEIHQGYVEGTTQLRQALDDYIKLYADVENSTVDQSAYNARIAEIQKSYDAGVQTLQETDEKAAALE